MRKKIGVFDSGVGGISVLKILHKSNLNLEVFYIADKAYCPYGEKDITIIKQRTYEIVKYFYEEIKVEMVLIACNTAAITSLQMLRKAFPIPIYGINEYVLPATLPFIQNNTVAVMATKASVDSKYYQSLFKEKGIVAQAIACQELVNIVECDLKDSAFNDTYIKQCLDIIIKQKIKTVVLGCTHFPLLKEIITQKIPSDVVLIDPAQAMIKAIFVADTKQKTSLLQYHFYSTSKDNDVLKKVIAENMNIQAEVIVI